jgi:hypothetical protein
MFRGYDMQKCGGVTILHIDLSTIVLVSPMNNFLVSSSRFVMWWLSVSIHQHPRLRHICAPNRTVNHQLRLPGYASPQAPSNATSKQPTHAFTHCSWQHNIGHSAD